MEIEVETEKKINIYALWEGKQIMLCKGKPKSTEINGVEWICLWPGRAPIYRPDISEPTEFGPSPVGSEYLADIDRREIRGPIHKNEFIAKVEYIGINGKNRKLWEELEAQGHFIYWDIDNGPMKYFANKGKNYIAIYQVYRVPGFSIKESSLVPDANGNLRTHYKRLTPETSQELASRMGGIEEVIRTGDFNTKRDEIRAIAAKYPPVPAVSVYTRRNTPGIKSHEETGPLNFKFCIHCGAKLPAEAAYCYKCGQQCFK